MSLRRRRLRGSGGATAVELALVLPVLLLLLIGILDFARVLNARVTISSASIEGARYATVHPTAAPSAIASAVRARAVPLDAASLTVAVSYRDGATFRPWPATGLPAGGPQASPIPVRVTVTYPWSATSVLAPFLPGVPVVLTASSTMDVLR